MSDTDDHRQSRIFGDDITGPMTSDTKISAALVRLSLKVRRRPEDEIDHAARMETYLRDLRAYPVDTVLKALETWPDRSEWWPTWHELLDAISEYRDSLALPPPPSGKGPIPDDIMYARTTRPYMFRYAWVELQQAIKIVEERGNKPEYLAQLRMIERFQEPYARAQGWT